MAIQGFPDVRSVQLRQSMLSELRRQVDAYDRAAQKGFMSEWTEATLLRGARDWTGHALDRRFRLPSVSTPFFEAVKQDAVGYNKLFGIEQYRTAVGKGHEFRTYRAFFQSPTWHQDMAQDIKDNFKNAKFLGADLKTYVQKTLVADNIHTITHPLSEGRIFTTASKALGAY